ncbi:MAG TPA: alpha/beta fold hydrolase [Gemmatimonadaceae bacterium]|nr:alpha/beta fold hydrolase [Gemmatimonadaceae bacterium]
MGILLVVVVAAAVLASVLLAARKQRLRAADRQVAAHLPLGSGGLIAGAQPWSHDAHARAALLIHGFGDTPQSLMPLAERLAEAGWSVSVPLLPGHGRSLSEFRRSNATQWATAVERTFDDLATRHQTVVVCGQSMGAALAISLARRKHVPALVLLAPYVAFPRKARLVALAWPLVEMLVPVVKIRDPLSIRDPHAAERSLAYGYVTPRLLAELWRVVRAARRDLPHVRSGALIVHSREDNRMPAHEVAALAARLTNPVKAVHWVSGCGHVIAVDYCKETVATLVVEWLERCTAPQGATASLGYKLGTS